MTMESTKNDFTQLEQYIKNHYPNLKGSHFTTMIDIIFMAAVRNDINITVLLKELYKGVLNTYSFNSSNRSPRSLSSWSPNITG